MLLSVVYEAMDLVNAQLAITHSRLVHLIRPWHLQMRCCPLRVRQMFMFI